jgi:hypothetical protein
MVSKLASGFEITTMNDQLPIREPQQIRQDCATKLRKINTSPMFTAILACLLDEDWTIPRILQLCMTHDRCLLARTDADVGFDKFLGAEADLIRNIHGIAEAASLDGDELGDLLGKVAALKGPQ